MQPWTCPNEALKKAVQQLVTKRRLVAVRRDFFVIVPVEYREAGAAHQQPQEFQIVTNEQLRPAVARLFGDEFLAREVAFRGGTALHELHLSPPGRYSEDIDILQVDAGPHRTCHGCGACPAGSVMQAESIVRLLCCRDSHDGRESSGLEARAPSGRQLREELPNREHLDVAQSGAAIRHAHQDLALQTLRAIGE